MHFPIEAFQTALRLALRARQQLALGRAIAATDADQAQEHYLEAYDAAREAGLYCGRHDLPMPWALQQVPALRVAFEEAESEGREEREAEVLDESVTA